MPTTRINLALIYWQFWWIGKKPTILYDSFYLCILLINEKGYERNFGLDKTIYLFLLRIIIL